MLVREGVSFMVVGREEEAKAKVKGKWEERREGNDLRAYTTGTGAPDSGDDGAAAERGKKRV